MKIEISPFISYTDLHGEIILANMETGLYFSIGGVGKQIWNALLKGKDVGSIIESIAEEYQIEQQVLKADVKEFLNNLANRKIIRIVGEKSGA